MESPETHGGLLLLACCSWSHLLFCQAIQLVGVGGRQRIVETQESQLKRYVRMKKAAREEMRVTFGRYGWGGGNGGRGTWRKKKKRKKEKNLGVEYMQGHPAYNDTRCVV